MKSRIESRFRSRPLSSGAIAACALAVAVVCVWQAVLWAQLVEFKLRSDAALSAARADASAPRARSIPYIFRGERLVVYVPVSAAELRVARQLPTERVFSSRGVLRAAYLRVMADAAQRDPVVEAVTRQLRATRADLGLDADEYAELIARFAQQIPYGVASPRFGPPAVVVAEGRAVCADKAVLLAALLVHEGYDAAVIAIDSNYHAAVGVRGRGPGYLGSGYAYIETTLPAYIGEVPPECGGSGPIEARTQIVPVGGRRAYTSDLESQFIGDTLIRARQAARQLEPYGRYASTASGSAKECFAGLAEQQQQAVRLARSLRLATDNRTRMYALMTRSGGR